MLFGFYDMNAIVRSDSDAKWKIAQNSLKSIIVLFCSKKTIEKGYSRYVCMTADYTTYYGVPVPVLQYYGVQGTTKTTISYLVVLTVSTYVIIFVILVMKY